MATKNIGKVVPVKGVDYFTEEDKQELIAQIEAESGVVIGSLTFFDSVEDLPDGVWEDIYFIVKIPNGGRLYKRVEDVWTPARPVVTATLYRLVTTNKLYVWMGSPAQELVEIKYTASNSTYDNSESGLTAEEVQGAIDEINTKKMDVNTTAPEGTVLASIEGKWASSDSPALKRLHITGYMNMPNPEEDSYIDFFDTIKIGLDFNSDSFLVKGGVTIDGSLEIGEGRVWLYNEYNAEAGRNSLHIVAKQIMTKALLRIDNATEDAGVVIAEDGGNAGLFGLDDDIIAVKNYNTGYYRYGNGFFEVHPEDNETVMYGSLITANGRELVAHNETEMRILNGFLTFNYGSDRIEVSRNIYRNGLEFGQFGADVWGIRENVNNGTLLVAYDDNEAEYKLFGGILTYNYANTTTIGVNNSTAITITPNNTLLTNPDEANNYINIGTNTVDIRSYDKVNIQNITFNEGYSLVSMDNSSNSLYLGNDYTELQGTQVYIIASDPDGSSDIMVSPKQITISQGSNKLEMITDNTNTPTIELKSNKTFIRGDYSGGVYLTTLEIGDGLNLQNTYGFKLTILEDGLTFLHNNNPIFGADGDTFTVVKKLQNGLYTTAQRPVLSSGGVGTQIYDTTLGKPIWWNGTNWTDAMGNIV